MADFDKIEVSATLNIPDATSQIQADLKTIESQLKPINLDVKINSNNINQVQSQTSKVTKSTEDLAAKLSILQNRATGAYGSFLKYLNQNSQAAEKLQKRHQVILMIDLGDLREGLYHRDFDRILATAQAVKQQRFLELAGTGTNLTCFGGILPDEHNMGVLLDITKRLREALDLPIPLISGGNSSSLHLLFEGRLPQGINHLRVGEGLLLGMDTAVGKPFPQLHQDAFTLHARLIEVKDKPSKPEGHSGPNAFGEYVTFPDLGPMRRGILAIGRQDTDADGLTPKDERVKIIGASSDHLIVDLTGAPEYQVGDLLAFTPDYGALLKAYTSPYVTKENAS